MNELSGRQASKQSSGQWRREGMMTTTTTMMMRSCLGGGLPVAVMFCLNVVAAVMVSLVKVAMNGGMNPLVIVTLQQLTAAVFLAPIAFFKER